MKIRHLTENDYNLNYLGLISQLSNTITIQVSFDQFKSQLQNIKNSGSLIYIIEDDGILVASGTLLIEKKFIHDFGQVGHIEDIVVHNNHRGKGYAQKIVNFLIQLAFEKECYKVILDCKEDLIKLYEKCGFVQKEYQMANYKNK